MSGARVRVAVLTVSDAGARGERADTSGDAIVEWATARGYTVAERSLIPDESDAIRRQLTDWADRGGADLILTYHAREAAAWLARS